PDVVEPWGIVRETDSRPRSRVESVVRAEVPAGSELRLRRVSYKPLGAKPLFNGKDLTGWKVFDGDPKRMSTKFEVTRDGELSARNGPGDLQTVAQYDNFVL